MDPKLGRFLTQDSYVGQIDEPPSLHRYAYARNQPTVYVDPSGNIALVDNAVGGVASVAIGWGVSKLTGQDYSWKDAAVDFGLGFVSSGLSSVTKLKHAGKLANWAMRAGTEAAVDAGAEVARKEWKGEDYTAGELAQGAAANLVVGEAGAAAGRKIGKWWRGFRNAGKAADEVAEAVDSPNLSEAQKSVNLAESRLGRGDAPVPGASADVSARPAGSSAAPPPPYLALPSGPPSPLALPAGSSPRALIGPIGDPGLLGTSPAIPGFVVDARGRTASIDDLRSLAVAREARLQVGATPNTIGQKGETFLGSVARGQGRPQAPVPVGSTTRIFDRLLERSGLEVKNTRGPQALTRFFRGQVQKERTLLGPVLDRSTFVGIQGFTGPATREMQGAGIDVLDLRDFPDIRDFPFQ